jgi:hypothetical protein
MTQRRIQTGPRERIAPDKRVLVRVGDKEWVVGDSIAHPSSVREVGQSEPIRPLFHAPGPAAVSPSGRRSRHTVWRRVYGRWVEWANLQVARACDLLRPLSGQDDVYKATGFRPQGSVRRLRDSFQTGLTMGLVLGCLSLLWFHQLEPWRGDPSATPAAATVAEPAGRDLTVPGFDVMALTAGRFSSAAAVPAQFRGSAPDSVALWTLPSGEVLAVARASITAKPLQDQSRSAAGGAHLTVTAVHVPVQQLPVRMSVAAKTDTVSRWLFAEAAALRTLTAVAMQGTSVNDAVKAYHNAAAVRPAPDVLDSTGYGAELTAFANQVDLAFSLWNEGNAEAARFAVVKAYGAWLNLFRPDAGGQGP